MVHCAVETTNMAEVRRLTKALFDEVKEVTSNKRGMIKHPFSLMSRAESLVTEKDYRLTDPADYAAWKNEVCDYIDDSDTSAFELAELVTNPWKNYWMASILPYLAQNDLTSILISAWGSYDAPAVSTGGDFSALITYFQCADKKRLMNEKEYKIFENIPDKITLYRGYSMGYKAGISWTDDKDVAVNFASKDLLGNKTEDGKLVSITIPKELCLAFYDWAHTYIVDIDEVKKRGISIKNVKS